MKILECAICGKSIVKATICRSCCKQYNLNADWVKTLLEEEKLMRKLEKRDKRYSVAVLSDRKFYIRDKVQDEWDALEGEIEGASLVQYHIHDERRASARERLLTLARQVGATDAEYNALMVYCMFSTSKQKVRSEVAAVYLTELEGKSVSAEAYRSRMASVKRKIRLNSHHESGDDI